MASEAPSQQQSAHEQQQPPQQQQQPPEMTQQEIEAWQQQYYAWYMAQVAAAQTQSQTAATAATPALPTTITTATGSIVLKPPSASRGESGAPSAKKPKRETDATPSSMPMPTQQGGKKFAMQSAGEKWEDPSLAEWPENDFRLFVGDIGNDCTDDMLKTAFAQYPSFQKAKVVRERWSGKSKGFAFVSFSDPVDYAKALREMNGKYVGSRPMRLIKSKWKDRLASNATYEAKLPPPIPSRTMMKKRHK